MFGSVRVCVNVSSLLAKEKDDNKRTIVPGETMKVKTYIFHIFIDPLHIQRERQDMRNANESNKDSIGVLVVF